MVASGGGRLQFRPSQYDTMFFLTIRYKYGDWDDWNSTTIPHILPPADYEYWVVALKQPHRTRRAGTCASEPVQHQTYLDGPGTAGTAGLDSVKRLFVDNEAELQSAYQILMFYRDYFGWDGPDYPAAPRNEHNQSRKRVLICLAPVHLYSSTAPTRRRWYRRARALHSNHSCHNRETSMVRAIIMN